MISDVVVLDGPKLVGVLENVKQAAAEIGAVPSRGRRLIKLVALHPDRVEITAELISLL